MEVHTPLPPFAALCRPSLPFLSGNRRNVRRIRRVDGGAELLGGQTVRERTRMYAVARERRPERVHVAWLADQRKGTNHGIGLGKRAQRIERGIGIEVRPAMRGCLRRDGRVIAHYRGGELDELLWDHDRNNSIGAVEVARCSE